MKLNLTPSLVKAVELSTAHITLADSELLARMADEYAQMHVPPVVMKHECGYVIAIGSLTCKLLIKGGGSSEFSAILNACDKSGDIMYLCFDRDAQRQDDLPDFNW